MESPASHPSAARPLFFIFGMPLVLAVLYYGWLAVQVSRMPYTWRDMDWNGDGKTSIREFFATADVLERPLVDAGSACREFYNARSGKRMALRCP